MGIAAVPAYLGNNFDGSSPGLNFGMYLPVWNAADWSREQVKTDSLKKIVRLSDADKQRMVALRERHDAVATTVPAGQILSVEALSVAPFATGLGNEHPLENGFAFLKPYGLPYLAGSGVKGVLRKAACELAEGLFGKPNDWTQDAMEVLFGKGNGGTDENGLRGALIVWDVVPELAGGALRVDVMTAHQSHYLIEADTPHESGKPNPINFLTVPPGSRFDFHVQCDVPFLRRQPHGDALVDSWKALVTAALEHAFKWLGFGAKTAVGYGAMRVDPQAARRRQQAEQARKEAAEEARTAREREKQLQAMPPAERAIQKCLDDRMDPNIPENTAIFNALKTGCWQGGLRHEILEIFQSRLEQSKQWVPVSAKRRPEKDTNHQMTLRVMQWLKE